MSSNFPQTVLVAPSCEVRRHKGPGTRCPSPFHRNGQTLNVHAAESEWDSGKSADSIEIPIGHTNQTSKASTERVLMEEVLCRKRRPA